MFEIDWRWAFEEGVYRDDNGNWVSKEGKIFCFDVIVDVPSEDGEETKWYQQYESIYSLEQAIGIAAKEANQWGKGCVHIRASRASRWD